MGHILKENGHLLLNKMNKANTGKVNKVNNV